MKDECEFYLQQIGESAKRSRLVLYLLLVSSAVIFAFDWEDGEGNWLQSRVDIRRAVLNHWQELKPNATNLPAGLTQSEWEVAKKRELAALSLLGLDPKYTNDEKVLLAQTEHLDQLNHDPFNLPFTRINIDDNDFVCFGAVELLILAVVFFHALVREEENLEISFASVHKTKQDGLGEFYKMASMQQVWTVPYGKERSFTKSLLRVGLWAIFFLPVFVIWWVLVRQAISANATLVLNATRGWMEMVVQYIAIPVLTVNMVLCAFAFHRINRIWEKYFKLIE